MVYALACPGDYVLLRDITYNIKRRGTQTSIARMYLVLPVSALPLVPSISYVTSKVPGMQGGSSQCDDVYMKHTSVWEGSI